MHILLTRLTNDRHALEIVRADGSRDRMEFETKSTWLHDLLHFAVEREARLQDGFWGALAAGTTFAQMKEGYEGLAAIEMLVGALTSAAKGADADAVVATIRNFIETSGKGPAPEWLTGDFVRRVQERMRGLVGHWKGTRFGEVMELEW